MPKNQEAEKCQQKHHRPGIPGENSQKHVTLEGIFGTHFRRANSPPKHTLQCSHFEPTPQPYVRCQSVEGSRSGVPDRPQTQGNAGVTEGVSPENHPQTCTAVPKKHSAMGGVSHTDPYNLSENLKVSSAHLGLSHIGYQCWKVILFINPWTTQMAWENALTLGRSAPGFLFNIGRGRQDRNRYSAHKITGISHQWPKPKTQFQWPQEKHLLSLYRELIPRLQLAFKAKTNQPWDSQVSLWLADPWSSVSSFWSSSDTSVVTKDPPNPPTNCRATNIPR